MPRTPIAFQVFIDAGLTQDVFVSHNYHMSQKTALILSGGGARGAYQVGVLKGLAEILESKKMKTNPFQILSGVSAGAINTAKLASCPDDFSTSVEKLIYLWSQLKSDQVYKTNLFSLDLFSIAKIFKDRSSLSFNALLDTTPLKKLLEEHIDFKQIAQNIKDKKYESVIITANNYHHQAAVSFIDKQSGIKKSAWHDSRRVPEYTTLDVEHVMASAAIPVLFPPININGDDYGDGCVRNNTPCSPSLRMGAEKLFVVGVRTQNFFDEPATPASANDHRKTSLVNIFNTLLNAVLLDSVEQDVHRIQRINELVRKANLHEVETTEPNAKNKTKLLKEIPALCISPSVNIGEIARAHAHHLPRLLRTTLNAFGSLDDANEIISYLLFDADFCKKLISHGYDDAFSSKKEICDFFEI